MAGNEPYFTSAGGKKLPLYEFFMALKNNGFLVTPQQILDCNHILTEYAGKVKDEAELGKYICPLFANTKEEQVQFNELFNQYFVEAFRRPAPVSVGKRIGSHLEKYNKYYMIALAICVIVLLWPAPEPPHAPQPYLVIQPNDSAQNYIIAKPNEDVSIGYAYPKADTAWQTRLHINWGDSDVYDTLTTHRYRESGSYNVTVKANTSNGEYEYTDTLKDVIHICNKKNYVTIISSEPENEIYQGDSITLTANVTGETPDSIRWMHDDSLYGYGDSIRFYFTNEGTSRFTCEAIYRSADACFASDHIDLTITDPHKPRFKAVITPMANAEPYHLKYKVRHKSFVHAIWFSVITFILLLVILWWTSRLRKKTVTETESTLKANPAFMASPPGPKTFKEIPFRDKNYLALPEATLGESARLMRRRISDETLFINIRKTIQRATENYGLFLPVFDERTQQSEFLVLIDQNQKNSLLLPLFNFLLDQLEKQGAYIHRYYYRDDFSLFYSKSHPQGITLEKLHDRHQKNILLIFGNGYPLLFEHYPVPNHALLKAIRHWKFQAVITPVPYPDWGVKERMGLMPEIALIPCDADAITLLLQALFAGNTHVADELEALKNRFYSVKGYDFENVDDLKRYCDTAAWSVIKTDTGEENVLFQWIASLTLYPKIKWEIVLALGKALLDACGKPEELNYTNLLRICRIPWIANAQFPDYTRLDLLKKLTPANELAGRNALLALFAEIPADAIQPNHTSYEELQHQRVINEFNLYAHDPIQYAQYNTSRDAFEKLWNENKILDAPVKKYLKNEGREWQTLIPDNSKNLNKGITSGATVESYLKAPKEKNSLIYNIASLLAGLDVLLFLSSLLWLMFLGVLHYSNTSRFKSFTTHTAGNQQVSFLMVNRAADTTSYEASVMWDNTTTPVHVNDTFYLPVNITDSLQHIVISYAGQMVLDTQMVIGVNRFMVSVHDADETPQSMNVTLQLAPGCSNLLYRYKQILVQTGLPLIISDSVTDAGDVNDTATVCINQVSYGEAVDEQYLQKIVNEFNAEGIALFIDRQAIRKAAPNEIIIYHYSGERIQKPTVYLQYNNKQKRDAVNSLRQCLNKGMFECPAPELRANNTVNEIRYYDNSFADSVTYLMRCLESTYPKRKFSVKRIPLNHNPQVRAEIWIYDSVATDSRTVTKVYYENKDKTITGSFTYLGNLIWKEEGNPGTHLFKETKSGKDYVYMDDMEAASNPDRDISIKIDFRAGEIDLDSYRTGRFVYLYTILNGPPAAEGYNVNLYETISISMDEYYMGRWEWTNRKEITIVDSVSTNRTRKAAAEGTTGVPKLLTWTFKGLRPGTQTLVFAERILYDPQAKPKEKRITITVVRPAKAK